MKKRHLGLLLLFAVAIGVWFIFIVAGVPGAGTIKLNARGARVTLKSNGFLTSRTTYLTDELPEQKVKAGSYRIESIALDAGADNETWLLTTGYNRTGQDTINVIPDQTTELKIGPPLTVRTDMQRRGGIVTVGLHITGIAGESYSPYIIKNGRVLPPPKVTIMDKSQHILSAGKFEYG